MTANDLASPRVEATIETLECRRQGRTHHGPRCLLVWRGNHLTEAATTDDDLLRCMIRSEMRDHGGVDVREGA